MASSLSPAHFLLLLISSILFSISPSTAKTSSSSAPKALVLPIFKDDSSSTPQYLTHIKQRTPLVSVKLSLDLGGQLLWIDCDNDYVSTSYKPISCSSSECKIAKSIACVTECYSRARPGCYNNTCSLDPDNPFIQTSTSGQFGQDRVIVRSTDGKNPGRLVSLPDLQFTCGATFLLQGLAKGVTGIAGLGNSRISLPHLFSSGFHFNRKFAICFPSSTKSTGVLFFGSGPYVMLPGIKVSKNLIYTPIISNKNSPYAYPHEYFIHVKSIKVHGSPLYFNSSLLSIKKGVGGTKISSSTPYTVVHSSIYYRLTEAFAKLLGQFPVVRPVKPFTLCYNSTNIGSTRVGPAVPNIELVLENGTSWIIFGSNSMVQVKEDVLCLGFESGGDDPGTSIVIGAYQLENNLLQFDLGNKRLGFSSSLLFRQTTCANFNFTSAV